MAIISSTKYSRKFNALKFAHFCCWRDMCRKYLIYTVNSNCCTNILLARKLWVASDIFCLKLHEMCTTDNLIWRNIQLLQFKAFLSRLLVCYMCCISIACDIRKTIWKRRFAFNNGQLFDSRYGGVKVACAELESNAWFISGK